MPIQYFKQDLVPILEKLQFQVFAHGCNCFNTMGAGIAQEVARIFPTVWEADQVLKKGDVARLGTICTIPVPTSSSPHVVINAYTQFKYWGRGPHVDYEAVEGCFFRINRFMVDNGYTELTIPKIGAGLAGGDWSIVEAKIREYISDEINVNVYYL